MTEALASSFSELDWGLNNDPRHPLVQQVKITAAYNMTIKQDRYMQHATGMIRENANNGPQGMRSLFGNV
jgi:hypothetical protein